MSSVIKINGTQDFMGINIPIIEGGFGEDSRCILIKDIALTHNIEVREINQSIKRMIDKKRIKENIHYMDLKQVTDSDVFLEALKTQGYMTKAQVGNAKNIFLLSERGYSSLIKYMDDDTSWEVYDELIDNYFSLRQQVKNVLSETDKAILTIVNSQDPIQQSLAIRNFKEIIEKPLQIEIDKYSRFLCDKLSTLKKSELATKLDTKPQTLASLFKKLKIYTPKSQVCNEFLKKFENIKMIKQTETKFINPKTNKEETKTDWSWFCLVNN